MPIEKRGGSLLVETLVTHGTDHVFCIPGESYLAALDALYDHPEIEVVLCRQEGGAAMMAESYGKLKGWPGVCMVTRGPGATNASAGVHIAYQDSTPMILLIGQVSRQQKDREAYQEINYEQMFGTMAKWVAQIDSPQRIPEYINRAFYTAVSGRPGPVVLALPEDMLEEQVLDSIPSVSCKPVQIHPGSEDLESIRTALEQARKPVLLVGGGGWTAQARQDLIEFSENWNLPVAVSLRCHDYFDNQNSHFVGEVGVNINPALYRRIEESDVLLVLGPRLGEMTTGHYRLIKIPVPKQKLIHVHSKAEEIGRVYQPAIGVNSSPKAMIRALARLPAPAEKPWSAWTAEAHSEYLDWRKPVPHHGDIQVAEMMAWLSDRLPEDAILCTGAGNYANWAYRFYQYRGFRSQLAPNSGTMGYSVPAAVAAKKLYPDRLVVALAGDGCFMMHGQELATAAQYQLPVIVIVFNNQTLGTIRMHQEKRYPSRVVGTDLKNPDFPRLAEAYGGKGFLVRRTEEFYSAMEEAMKSETLSIIELRLDSDLIGPLQQISQIRAEASKK